MQNVRTIKARVDIYDGATLAAFYSHDGALISVEVSRTGGTNKFFGFGIAQKVNFHLIDTEREINISTANTIRVLIKDDGTNWRTFPDFKVTEVNRDENTNELSVTAYDVLDYASKHTVNELSLTVPYTIGQFASACATFLGISINGNSTSAFNTSYSEGANFNGDETIREALDMVAEATQTIYYINDANILVFKKLTSQTTARNITRADYFTLSSKGNKRLQTICSATELGDNVSESTSLVGSTQYVRENAFWNLRDDIGTLVHNAIVNVGDMTIGQYDLTWRGDLSFAIGSKIAIEAKDGTIINSYLLDDTIRYNGSLTATSTWTWEDEEETESNPTSIGEALKNTSARVDKVNQQITILAQTDDSLNDQIAQLVMDTEKIQLSVEDKEKQISDLSEDINTLTESVNASVTKDALTVEVNKILSSGVDSVTTSTGFTFDEKGLTVSKTTSSLTTTVDEDGIDIKDSGTQVFNADNSGVDARNLHATTYLIIGKEKGRSRFEDYGSDRTGCFWIG